MNFLRINGRVIKNLHLLISISFIIPIALVYGLYTNIMLSNLFHIKVETINLKNIFRAMMGLYLGISALWIISITTPKYRITATLTNIVFMGGLALGRVLSLVWDGPPGMYFLIGLILESALARWGVINLKQKWVHQT